MKKSLFTKVLTVLGAAVLTLPAVLGMNNNTVKAADATPSSQHVILTKYGFKEAPDETNRDTATQWNGDGAERLGGVEFEIYDVTANYWSDPTNYNGSTAAPAKLVSTETTADNGQFGIDLPKVSKDADGQDRAAVYVFHETNQRAGYGTAADFWLTLPAKADADGNVYVYPKNTEVKTYERNFIKKDSVTGEVLPGAQFVIKNVKGEYLQLTDKKGNNPIGSVTGYADVLAGNMRIKWVTDKGAATVFTSDKDGKFGLNGFANNSDVYTYEEIKAPTGYDKTADGEFKADDTTSDILDTPTGVLPHTGGKGIVAFVVAGVALIALGGLAYSKRRAA